jgi:Putative Ig domain
MGRIFLSGFSTKVTFLASVFTVLALASPTINQPHLIALNDVMIRDIFGRSLNNKSITLVDWEGYLANPAIKLNIKPPANATFPGHATVTANGVRLYFNLPSTVGPSGPSKSLTYSDASTSNSIYLSIFPDRDTLAENYELTVTFTDNIGQTKTTTLGIHVIDQDKNQSILFPLVVNFSKDQTGFFDDPVKRAIVQQAGNDWFYFFDDMHLSQVAAGSETTWIWNPSGFNSGYYTTNTNAYTGFMLYAYGIHTSALRSGGEGSYAGGFQHSGNTTFQIKRSGGVEIETAGNFNSLGWFLTTGDDDWWHTGNYVDEANDLYSIVHHEMGHAFMFNGAYPIFAQAKSQGQLENARILAYQGAYPKIDASDHFHGTVDRISKKGAFGYEYYGSVPQRRWLITKLDLLAAQAVGYRLRSTSAFVPFSVTTQSLQPGQISTPYTASILVRGGIPFYYFAVESGSLPDGLTLNSFTGMITGTPTATGTFNFVVRARDYDSQSSGVAVPFSITITSTPITTVTFQSAGINDGWVLESSETSQQGGTINATSTIFPLGDDSQNRQYRSILHFNTSSLPDNAVIVFVRLEIKQYGTVVGANPFSTHQNIVVDIRKGTFSNNPRMQLSDFQAVASKNAVGVIRNIPSGAWYSSTLSNTGFPYINLIGNTQLRLRFKLDDNNDSGADFVRFYSGNAGTAANRPILEIQYYVP